MGQVQDKKSHETNRNTDRINEIIQISSSERLFTFSDTKVEINKHEEIGAHLYGYLTSLILIAGSDCRILFKTHFMKKNLQSTLQKRLGRKENDVSDDEIIDFMREFSNLTGGLIKKTMAKDGVLLGISLPIILDGFSEALNEDKEENDRFFQSWELKWNDGFVICTSQVDVFNWSKINSLSKTNVVEDEGGIEFL